MEYDENCGTGGNLPKIRQNLVRRFIQAVGTDAAAIRWSFPKTTLEIRDMDACTTEEDVRGVI